MNEEKLLIAIITVIKRKRLQKGLSQENLAFSSGLDRTYISGVERGVRNLTINSLDAIIKGLNVSKKNFLEEVITIIEDSRNK
jgi:transcriptional regulator with XRE-family HTH domain